MPTTLAFVFVDFTTNKTPSELRPAQVFDRLIEALTEQANDHWAPAYGKQDIAFRVASGPEDRKADEIAINFRDEIPEAPGALAYHTVTGGVPDIEIGCDLFSALDSGNESMTSGVSHELLELLGDIGANGWKEFQDGSGKMRSEEVCDTVQNTGYQAKNGVQLSNFLLPSAFIPGAPAPWDYLGVMATQTDYSHGYEIQAIAPENYDQVTGTVHGMNKTHSKVVFALGALTDIQKKRKRHPYSRSYRRGLRL